MDETCVIWGQKCGETTNCLVYDIDKMRVYLAIFPAICIIISFIFDIGVWYHAKELSIYDEHQDGEILYIIISSNIYFVFNFNKSFQTKTMLRITLKSKASLMENPMMSNQMLVDI